MKSFLDSKTIWLAIFQAFVGGVIIFFTEVDMVGYSVLVKSIADIILRFLTTQPIATKVVE